MASSSVRTDTSTPTTPQSLESFLASRSERINGDEVVVLRTPDPATVVPGSRRYISVEHVKWLLKNILIDCTKYEKKELTGERIFWVPNPEETIKQHPKIRIPLN